MECNTLEQRPICNTVFIEVIHKKNNQSEKNKNNRTGIDL